MDAQPAGRQAGSIATPIDRPGTPTVSRSTASAVAAAPDKLGYVTHRSRRGRHGDVIDDRVSLRARARSSPTRASRTTRGRMAIERGPIVYCAEWPDVDGGTRARPPASTASAPLTPSIDKKLFGGVDRDPHRGRERDQQSRARRRSRCTLDSVSPLGEPRRGRDERVAADARTTPSATSGRRAASSSTRTRTTPPTAGATSRRRRSIRAPARRGAVSGG